MSQCPDPARKNVPRWLGQLERYATRLNGDVRVFIGALFIFQHTRGIALKQSNRDRSQTQKRYNHAHDAELYRSRPVLRSRTKTFRERPCGGAREKYES
jgi:hypothetical protein